MNALEFMASLVNILMACHALPMSEQVIEGRTYQVQQWSCQVETHINRGPLVITGYRRQCDTGHTRYWGRLVYLQFRELQTAAYVNQFGEIYVGPGAQLEQAYQPPCGS